MSFVGLWDKEGPVLNDRLVLAQAKRAEDATGRFTELMAKLGVKGARSRKSRITSKGCCGLTCCDHRKSAGIFFKLIHEFDYACDLLGLGFDFCCVQLSLLSEFQRIRNTLGYRHILGFFREQGG